GQRPGDRRSRMAPSPERARQFVVATETVPPFQGSQTVFGVRFLGVRRLAAAFLNGLELICGST
ncbi:MAG: hypothetical protein ACLQNE_13960, partial [Thermoguttaceae bacterium]